RLERTSARPLSWDIAESFNATNELAIVPNGGGTAVEVLSNGNVGIGTANPTVKLDVNGDTNISGNVNVSGNIGAKYQDVAEWVEASAAIEPGTVVIVDSSEPNRVLPASRSYDTRVAGAVSRQPGLVLGEAS